MAKQENSTTDSAPGLRDRFNTGLSAVVITFNEAADIVDCLRSLRQVTDEIIVLDSGSTDATCALARSEGATVHQSADWPGFGPQKKRAVAAARGPWVLSIDADERLSDALRDAIAATLQAPAADLYRMPRESHYCGQKIRHSGWSPDYVVRLFRKGCADFSNDLVHERLVPTDHDAAIGTLDAPLIHYPFRDLSEVLGKINSYSSVGARQAAARGRHGSLGRALLHGGWSFIRTYLLQRGFLDGKMGLILAISNAEGTYYRYLKLMMLKPPAAGVERDQ